jgi:hypothetical protein
MIGLNDSKPEKFVLFCFINVITSFVGNSLGLVCGTLFTTSEVAMAFMPMLILPFMMFGGYYQNRGNYGDWIGWIEYVSPF